jgi:hypothetical protein
MSYLCTNKSSANSRDAQALYAYVNVGLRPVLPSKSALQLSILHTFLDCLAAVKPVGLTDPLTFPKVSEGAIVRSARMAEVSIFVLLEECE